jgi:aminoglycoside phosphotransferase (APT) family kinase protein
MSLHHLIAAIAPKARLLRAWELTGGISARTTAITYTHDTRTERVVLRQPSATTLQRDPQAATREYCLLEQLTLHGLAVPQPILLDEQGTYSGSPGLVVSFIDGEPSYARTPVASFAEQIAAQLASIHSITAPTITLPAPPEPLASLPLPATHRLFDPQAYAALAAAWPWAQQNKSALLHGDFWPGNWLWRDGELVGIIDWEDAALGDPLIDLAICRLELLWIFGPDVMEEFMQAYRARMSLHFGNLPYWDLYAAMRLARLVGSDLEGWAAFFEPFGRGDITAETIAAHHRWFVRQALAQLPAPSTS